MTDPSPEPVPETRVPLNPAEDAPVGASSSGPTVLSALLPAATPAASTSGPAPPASVPGFELLEQLGQGGMGVVWKARQLSLNRLVALKMIRAGVLASGDERDRFQTEAEAVARLQHPNIVQIFDIGEHHGQPYFSLEFCPGGSLAALLAGKPLPPEDAARMLVPLARGIHHAHEAGILHRDLKPGNVLLSFSRESSTSASAALVRDSRLNEVSPKITDFGLAKHLDAESRTCQGEVMGTPSYMAPEQAQGKIHLLGPPTDVYALGAILYECLTGRPPFGAATPMETLLEVNSREPVSVRTLQPKVPRDLETICLKCLQKDRARRYATAGELADDLERFLDGRPIQARPISPVEHAWRWVRRHPAQAALALVILAAVTAGVIGWGWFTAQLGRQRDEADRLRLLAEERQEEAEANRELAEGRFEKALAVANRYFTEVSENTLLNEPGMEPLRQKLLRNARDFYTGFVRERRGDPRLANELARSLYRLAVIDADLGDLDGAVKQLGEAREQFDHLLEASPRDRELLEGRARLLNDLGRLERLRDRPEPAAMAFADARPAWEALLQQAAGSRGAKEGLGRCLLGLGNVELAQRRRENAERHYREALRLRQELVDADGGNDVYLRDLAVTWQNLAVVQSQLGDKAAGASNAQALAVFRRLVEAHPTRGRFRADLAMASFNEGHRLMHAKQFGPAAELYEESVRGFEFLTFTHPGVPVYATRCGHALWNLGLCQEKLDKLDVAQGTFSKAQKLRQTLAEAHPAVPEYQVALAQCYHRDGDRNRDAKNLTRAAASYTKAREILDQAERKAPGSPQVRALLAEVLIEQGGIARKTDAFDEAERRYDEAIEKARALVGQKQFADKAAEFERVAREGLEETKKARKKQKPD